MLLFAEVGEELEEKQGGGGGKPGFGFEPIKFELPIKQPSVESK